MAAGLEPLVLAVDAGGSYTKFALCRLDGLPVEGSFGSLPMDSAAGADAILSVFEEVASRALSVARSLNGRIAATGVCFPGPFDFAGGKSLLRHKYASIYGLPLRPVFSGGEDIPVVFEQDAIAFLLGEAGAGSGRGFSDLGACTLGTGLGYACMSRGKVLRNELGSPHVGLYKAPLRGGLAEDFVSARSIVARWRRICRPQEASMGASEIGGLADSGDERAKGVLADMGSCLGEVILEEARSRRLECLVLGGQVSRSFEHFAPALRESLGECPSLRAIRQAERIDDAALVGVAIEAAGEVR